MRSHLLFHGLKNFAFGSQEEQRISKAKTTSISQISSSRKREIDQAILKRTIEASLPFGLFNHDAVIELFNALESGYEPPDRRTLSQQVHDQYHHHILGLKSILVHVGPLAFVSVNRGHSINANCPVIYYWSFLSSLYLSLCNFSELPGDFFSLACV